MIKIKIPGFGQVSLKHLVLDYNGTMARDGRLLPGVAPLIKKLSRHLDIYVLTADTFGLAQRQLEKLPLSLTVMPEEDQDRGKRDFVRKLGAENTAAVGNGRNDSLMLKEAAVGICLVQKEGASGLALSYADIVCNTVIDALELFINKKRLTATLRS